MKFNFPRFSNFIFWLGPLVAITLFIGKSLIAELTELPADSLGLLGVAFWMISWWITEIAPLGIIALFPLVLFPLMGVTTLKNVCTFYTHPIIFLFMGGFMIAIALEKTKLSDRFALNIIKATGDSAGGILKGFIISTTLLSMWISNTATTVMMIPIASAVLTFVQDNSEGSEKSFQNFGIALMLCLAYSANIGGIMTPIGTPPNVVLMGLLDAVNIKVNFFDWMKATIPVAFVLLILMRTLVGKWLFPFEIKMRGDIKSFLQEKIAELGPMSREQKITLVIFCITCLLWIFKSPINKLLGHPYFNDTLTAMIGGIAVFLIPVRLKQRRREFILDKNDIPKLPWNIILLFGGGLALANGMSQVGLVEIVGLWLKDLSLNSDYLMVFIITSSVLFLTEVMSNVALCNIALPVIITLAQLQGVSVLLYAVPAALASSFAFSMPISTPPNVIVFSTGKLEIKDMMKAGILLNLISIIVVMTVGWFMIQLLGF